MEGEARQDGWRKDVRIDFNKLRGGERGLKVEICEVHRSKKASDETTELKRMFTQGREATKVEGGTEASRRSPPAVPRTRRSTPVS